VSGERLQLRAERAPFVMLPRWLLHHRGISDGAKVLYGMLHDLVAGREGPTRPVTRGQLAACCDVSVATVDRRLAELVAAGAVEKQAQFETHQGQLANVYLVRLSPPAANLLPPVENSEDPGCISAVPPSSGLQPPQLQSCADGVLTGAAPYEEEEKQEIPPQPPRTAGGRGHASHNGNGLFNAPRPVGGRRAAGTSPRAADALVAAERERERAAQLEAELEAKTAARLAAERAGEADRVAFEAEALAVSAALDDPRLAAIVDAVRGGMAGPLARSPLAVTRAVVDWCRAVTADGPDGTSLAAAADAALAAAGHLRVEAGEPAGLTVEGGTVPLRRRVAELLVDPVAVG
jgi:hypothetical protein